MQARTYRLAKKKASKDGGKTKPKRRAGYSTVACPIHGTKSGTNNIAEVRCSIPRNKREKYSGCPRCQTEKRAQGKK